MKNQFRSFSISLLMSILVGCGGGGDGNDNPPSANATPVAIAINAAPSGSAGVDQQVRVGATVTVDAGASFDANGDALTYKWAISTQPAKSTASLSAATSVRPTFIADIVGTYIVTLVANDGKVDSLPATATIIASGIPEAVNDAPVANAGPNQTSTVGSRVTLSGSLSSDRNGDTLKYKWTLVSRPTASAAAILHDDTVNPAFTLDALGTYSIALTVNDGKADSLPSTVLVSAAAAPSSANVPPVANAGTDQTVSVGSTVNLDGSLSVDPNGDKLTYAWSLTSRPLASNSQISGAALLKPQFIADATGIYEVSLTVNDGKVSSIFVDKINIIALSANAVVIQDSGIYRCATLTKERAALLYTQGHTYLDRDHDGRPCEANDIANETASPYVAPTTPSGGMCWVNGYYRKSGTYVKGYYRRC